ncbi:SAM-dependent methyltransferase [Luteibacter sp. HA06]|jgi:SAM-dependent methyltransferase
MQAEATLDSSYVLSIYDAWVLGFCNRFAWRCPTETVLLPFYLENVGLSHLDVGSGSGFYPAHMKDHTARRIDLMDIDEKALLSATARVAAIHTHSSIQAYRHDARVLFASEHRYDSIALLYVLHVIAGDFVEKAKVIGNLKHHLNDGGVLFGAMILGDTAQHNPIGQKLLRAYNRDGTFHNRSDSIVALRSALGSHFRDVRIRKKGVVAMFTAREPIDDK